jgi:hypothetical protein
VGSTRGFAQFEQCLKLQLLGNLGRNAPPPLRPSMSPSPPSNPPNPPPQVAITSVISALPMLGNILLGGIFFLLVWGILGMELYQGGGGGGVWGGGGAVNAPPPNQLHY